MTSKDNELRNFLFFLNETHPLSIEDSLVGALSEPSSWTDVVDAISQARKEDVFARSIDRVQLYVHVPFCGRLCTFCHCARVLLRRRSQIDAYIKALKVQMKELAPAYRGMNADTLCFGGGTPSVLSTAQIADILDGADSTFPSTQRKILFEINPSSWSSSKLSMLAERGLYRLSIGVQSLDEQVLRNVSRPQTQKKVLWCLRSARKAGIPCVNVDLMAGLPGQSVQGFVRDLKMMLDEGANVIHVYPYCDASLQELRASGKTGVDFFKRRDHMMRLAKEILQKNGFSRKGLGAYTQSGDGEEHQEEAYVHLRSAVAGFGPYAKSQFPGAVFFQSAAWVTAKDPSAVSLAREDLHYAMAHYAVIAMIDGLSEKVFKERFGVPFKTTFASGLKFLEQEGLVASVQGVWKFAGKWEIRRIREYVAQSRVLFGQDMIVDLRGRLQGKYDPQKDYSTGSSLLKGYANSWLMTLYYRMGV